MTSSLQKKPSSGHVSVVIPTHNPRSEYLARVIEALRHQTLPHEQWELLLIDNGSRVPLAENIRLAAEGMRSEGESMRQAADGKRQETSLPSRVALGYASRCLRPPRRTPAPTFPPFTELDLSWHPNARVVREEKLGLTFARLRGFAEAKGELIVMVDDDNVLAPDYLETAVRIAQERPGLGAFGGKCLAEFEVKPDAWLEARGKGLGLRDRGEAPQLFPEETGGGLRDQELKRLKDEEPSGARQREASPRANRRLNTEDCKLRLTEFPDCAPIGAGMVLRREAARAYAERLDQKTKRRKDQELITDRKGDSLASGGDNDICLTVVEEGWQVGYLPQLQLTHLIPKQRMTLDYHKRMARDSMKSFILMLDQHGIRPWPAMPKWTLPLRIASDWLRVKPWQGPEQSLRFWGHVGMYEARSSMI